MILEPILKIITADKQNYLTTLEDNKSTKKQNKTKKTGQKSGKKINEDLNSKAV